MTLWNIIRDFFVQYIFGGMDSLSQKYSSNIVGFLNGFDNGAVDETLDGTVNDLTVVKVYYGDNYYYMLSIGDWLSTTATIITLCAICVFLFFFVRWLFRLTAGLVSGRG